MSVTSLHAALSSTLQAQELLRVNGYWDLGSYSIQLDPSNLALTTAKVTYIKRRGTFEGRIEWHEGTENLSSEQVYYKVKASPPDLEIYVENTHLEFTVHIYLPGKRPQTLAEKYAAILPGFGRELSSRMDYFLEWVEEAEQTDRRNFIWSLLELSKRDSTKQDEGIRKSAANAAALINRLESFAGANLEGAQLPFSQLRRSIFDGAVATQANFYHVDLSQSSFLDVNFKGSQCEQLTLGRMPSLRSKLILGEFGISHDQRLMASCHNTRPGEASPLISLWNLENWHAMPSLDLKCDATALAFSQSGQLAIADNQGRIHIWEREKSDSFVPVRHFNVSKNKVRSLQFSSLNSNYLGIHVEKACSSVWDISKKQKIIDLPEMASSPGTFLFSPTKPEVALCEQQGNLEVWNINEKKIQRQWSIRDPLSRSPVRLLRFSKDGKLLATLSGSKVTFWEVQTETKMREVTLIPMDTMGLLLEPSISCLYLTADFNLILYANDFSGGAVYIQSMQSEGFPMALERDSSGDGIKHLIAIHNEQTILGIGQDKICIWKVNSLDQGNLGVEPQPFAFQFNTQNKLQVAAWQPSFVATFQNNLKNYKSVTLKSSTRPLAFSPDGSLLIGISITKDATKNYQIQTVITQRDTGKIVWTLPSLDYRKTKVMLFLGMFQDRAISSDNRYLAACLRGSEGERIEVWDLKARSLIRQCNIQRKSKLKYSGFSFSSDNKKLAINFFNKQEKKMHIKLWDFGQDQFHDILEINESFPLQTDLQNSSFLIRRMRDTDTIFSLCDSISRKVLCSFEGTAGAFCPVNQLFAKGVDGKVSIMHVGKSEEITLLSGLYDLRPRLIATDLKFSENGRRLAARLVPVEVIVVPPKGLAYMNDTLATLYLWEIERHPFLHARLIDKLPHELNAKGAQFDSESGLSDMTRNVLEEKEAEIAPTP